MLREKVRLLLPLCIYLYSAAASAQMLESKAQSIGNRVLGLVQLVVPIVAVLAIIGASIAMMNAEPDAKRKLSMVIVGSAIAAVAPHVYPWIAAA